MKTHRYLLPHLALALAALSVQGCATEPTVAKASAQRDFKAEDYRKIAVVVQVPERVAREVDKDYGDAKFDMKSEGIRNAVESTVQMALNTKGYQVCERSQLPSVLQEINFQGELAKEQLAKVGDASGCKGVLVVNLDSLSKKEVNSGYVTNGQTRTHTELSVGMSAKIIDLKKCTSVWNARVNNPKRAFFTNGGDDETATINGCAEAIAAALPAVGE